jgi:hypothetical protein
MNWMVVALFQNVRDAQAAREVLTNAGIRSEVHDEGSLSKLWGGKENVSFARLEAAGEQFEQAEQLFIDWAKSTGTACGAIRCPECGSFRIDYPQYAKKAVLPNMVVGTLATIAGVEKQFYCNDCHCTWHREGSSPETPPANGAPHYFMEGVPSGERPPNPSPLPANSTDPSSEAD